MPSPSRTSLEWFQEAARCYVEQHQGCAWCGGAHRVYFVERDTQVQYYCSACEFRAGFERILNRYFFEPGEKSEVSKRTTMFQI